MSLINDALKRTKQAQEQQTPSLSRGAPLHIAAPPPRSSGLWALAVAALALAAVIAGVAVWYALQHRTAPAQAKVEPAPPPAVIETPVLPVIPAKMETPPPAPVAPPKKEIPPPPPIVAQQPAPQPAPPKQADFPRLQLQGILASPTRPAAIINSRTLYLGDKVAGVTVARITSDKVTVVWNGLTNVLALP